MGDFWSILLEPNTRKAVQRLHGAAFNQPRRRVKRPRVASRQVQHRISPTESDELVAAFQAGETASVLAERYGINEATVFGHLRRRGVRRGKRFRLSEADVIRATELYASGDTLNAVAINLGVCATTVRMALLRNGVRLRRRGI